MRKTTAQEKIMRRSLTLNTALVLLLVACTSSAGDRTASEQAPETEKDFLLTYPNVPAGEWEGIHSHPGNQIYVHIKGGEWSGRLGGKSEYSGIVSEDGGVGWMDPIPLSAGHDSGNTGDTPIDLIYVTLKGDAPIAPEVEHVPQIYPNIPLELLLENDRMIVQRVQVEPGQWEGIHSHPGNQVFIHIKGGEWSGRLGGKSTNSKSVREDGAVGWMDAIPLSAGHESGNTGDTTIDLIWVTLK
jgi:mannose-6-phosphate isomerase-like protein (cupin superfamily)